MASYGPSGAGQPGFPSLPARALARVGIGPSWPLRRFVGPYLTLPGLIDLARRSIIICACLAPRRRIASCRAFCRHLGACGFAPFSLRQPPCFGHVGHRPSALAAPDSSLGRVARKVLDLVVIGLAADLIWQAAGVLIDAAAARLAVSILPLRDRAARRAC